MSAELSVEEGGARRITGSLDLASAAALYRRTRELLSGGPEIRLELSGVEAAGSAGIALLLEWQRQAHRRGVHLAVTGMPESVRRVARLSGVERLVESGADAADVRQAEPLPPL